MMLTTVLPWVMGLFAVAMALSAWRLFKGPGLPDRILALDTLYINALALLVLVGIQQDSTLYFEVALVIALFGFIGTVLLSKFVTHREIAG